MLQVTFTWICGLILVVQCAGYKILVAFPCPLRSHNIMGRGVVKNLLKAGHEVTFITPFLTNNTNPNLREIDVTENVNAMNFSIINIESLMEIKPDFDQDSIFKHMMIFTEKTLYNDNLQKIINDPNEHFDVVISQWMFNEVLSGIAVAFDCPHIWFLLNDPGFAALSLVDEPTNPSYVRSVELNFIPPLTFWQRFEALMFQAKCMLRKYLVHRNIEKELFDTYFEPILARRNKKLPSYEQIRFNASLMLGNYHVSFGQAIRLPQNYIPVGGQHIDTDVAPLPAVIQKVMDEATNGVIYFSMGSALKSRELPDSIKQNLLKVFAELKQIVIWKFEEVLPNLPKNVHILKWAPQQSILSHPHCVIFITHGGILSTMEALHFAVPFIGIPVYFDQEPNVKNSVSKGVAIKVDLTYNLAENLKEAIHEMLSNPSYQQHMDELSFVYHHRPTPPGKELVHWVEHVILTKGAHHLRSPALLVPWYQKMYLDIVLSILMPIIMVFYTIKLCLRKRVLEVKKKIS